MRKTNATTLTPQPQGSSGSPGYYCDKIEPGVKMDPSAPLGGTGPWDLPPNYVDMIFSRESDGGQVVVEVAGGDDDGNDDGAVAMGTACIAAATTTARKV